MEERKETLLIVEDDLDIADMLNAYFRVQGYEVLTVNWGEDGVRACQTSMPDLVILDIRLPDIDGFEVAKRLRATRRTADIPIIFLTEKRERTDRLRGLELKADDYITKPFDIQELRLRVRNALSRSQRQPLTNPVTGLPEGALLDEAMENAIADAKLGITAMTIQSMAKFRDLYGFSAFDDMLRASAPVMKEALHESGGPEAYLGQLRPDWFVFIIAKQNLPALKERLRRSLDPSFEVFYSVQHLQSGLFADQPLAVKFSDPEPPTGGFQSLAQLKAELARLCR